MPLRFCALTVSFGKTKANIYKKRTMKKSITNGKVYYNFGPNHSLGLSEVALNQYVDEIIKHFGKELTSESSFEQARTTLSFAPYFGTEMFNYQDELIWYFPTRNMYAAYKRRIKQIVVFADLLKEYHQ